MIRSFIWFILSLIWTIIMTALSVFPGFFIKRTEYFHNLARIWGRGVCLFSGAEITVTGLEKIDKNKSYIVISNHQSAFDIYILAGILPLEVRFISKDLYFRIPFFGWAMKKAGYIAINRKNPRQAYRALQTAARVLTEKKSLIIFPEGTRSDGEHILPFKPGTMKIAFMGQNVNFLPVIISGAGRLNPRGTLRINKSKVTVKICNAVHYNSEMLNSREKQISALQQLEKIINVEFSGLQS
ncbi:MAG TPA: 1-acyl-sn-glycerol-3-phosphate acyltransferase [Spirochaetia bacterium]|nr:1-acyl-sn-glycerol-3-phosphate acyltransferase [Spirochaetia bacterium]